MLVANEWELADFTLDDYQRRGVTYIVSSSFVADAHAVDPGREARRREFYASLESMATRVAEFRPSAGAEPGFVYDRIYAPFDSLSAFDRPGPTIRVYALPRSGS